jgi:hypothetical protein
MIRTEQLSDILRTLDPAETHAPSEAHDDIRAQAMLARTLASPPAASISPLPRNHRRRLALTATAATALTAAALIIAPGFLGGPRAAAWSAVPITDADAAAAAKKSCTAQVRSYEVSPEMGKADLSRMKPVISDVRGPLVLVFLTDGSSELSCYYEDGHAGAAGAVASTDTPSPRTMAPDSVAGSGGSITSTSLGLTRAVTGRIGADVVSVVLDTVAKGPVTATVTGGYFAAWWPDDSITDETEDRAGPGDELKGVTVTLRDGTVRRVSVAELLSPA